MKISERNWKSKEIHHHYNKLKYVGKNLYIYRFDNFFTTNKIISFINSEKVSLLDVGIGQANFYRYLSFKKFKIDYTGADINPYFVEKSKILFPNVKFKLTDEELKQNLENEYDFVYSRGVSTHQSDPLKFLNRIIDKAKKGCVFDINTRDLGSTVYDTEKSCQYISETWVPHIVLNFDELINFLNGNTKLKNAKIEINKNYKILGGQGSRYLPKEMYENKTKCAQTSISIDFECRKKEIIYSYDKETMRKNFKYFKALLLDSLFRK